MITPLATWNARDRCRYLYLREQAVDSVPDATRDSAAGAPRRETAVSVEAP